MGDKKLDVSSIFSNWLNDAERPLRLLDHHFCVDVEKIEDFSSSPTCLHVHFKPGKVEAKPLPPPPPPKVLSCPPPINFELTIDVQQYTAEEIRVSAVGNVLVIEAKHEEKHGDHGHLSREFVRRCTVPPQSDITKAVARLSTEGILKITAPKKGPVCKPGERIIPIEKTGFRS